ncbi:alpha/beta hydrolase [Corallincola luteus]|uniref:Alpha/beta hydrolase n=1 Tax=Corallincola luteus TaxID=1775177 RepID=A0ABY2AKX7_9GAMM|nr:alpha/beta hydrolase [Corallincola luteus]TCI03299.1 alpha/beta hydrolase [Corallincola luteus]
MISKLLVMFSVCFLTACSSNWAFYAPKAESTRAESQYHFPYQNIQVTSQSGNKLDAQLHKTSVRSPLGLVMHFHGNRGNISETFDKVEWLLDEGYDVLVFDYSGYGRSEGAADPKVTYLDARSMLKIFSELSRPHDDYKKIVWGTSLGGVILISGLSEPGSRLDIDLMIVDSSFYRYSDTASHIASRYPLGELVSWIPALIFDDHYAPEGRLSQLPNVPLLFTHCETDTLIPIEFTEQLYEEAVGAKGLWRLPNCKHARSFANENRQNQKILLQVLEQPGLVAPEFTYYAARTALYNSVLAGR